MMNNWYFRTAVHHQDDGHTLRFEHPTLAGVAAGGWMERLKEEGQNILKPLFGKAEEASAMPKAAPVVKQEVSMISSSVKRTITADEFAAHSGPEQPWFAVKGEGEAFFKIEQGIHAESTAPLVYDGTPFMKDHPGGGESIMLVAGQDAVSRGNAPGFGQADANRPCRPRTLCQYIHLKAKPCLQSEWIRRWCLLPV